MTKPTEFDLMVSYIDEDGERQYDVVIMDVDQKLKMSGKAIKEVIADHVRGVKRNG